jgi:orotate phosphoribosyltransferase
MEQRMDDGKKRLSEILLEKAIKFGDFTLASGQKSSYYINCRLATLDSEGLYLISELMLNKLEGTKFDAVGGLTLGADPIIGAMTALAHQRGRKLVGFIVRKEAKDHGTKNLVEGPLAPGMKVAIVEDVATTGGSAGKAIEAARAMGCEIVKVMAIVDRRQGAEEKFREMGIAFDPIFRKEELGL